MNVFHNKFDFDREIYYDHRTETYYQCYKDEKILENIAYDEGEPVRLFAIYKAKQDFYDIDMFSIKDFDQLINEKELIMLSVDKKAKLLLGE